MLYKVFPLSDVGCAHRKIDCIRLMATVYYTVLEHNISMDINILCQRPLHLCTYLPLTGLSYTHDELQRCMSTVYRGSIHSLQKLSIEQRWCRLCMHLRTGAVCTGGWSEYQSTSEDRTMMGYV